MGLSFDRSLAAALGVTEMRSWARATKTPKLSRISREKRKTKMERKILRTSPERFYEHQLVG
jgi:hypothetical protein